MPVWMYFLKVGIIPEFPEVEYGACDAHRRCIGHGCISAWGHLLSAGYGIIISIGMLIGIALAYRETVRQHLNPDDLIDLLLLLIPSAVIGARLYYVIFRSAVLCASIRR